MRRDVVTGVVCQESLLQDTDTLAKKAFVFFYLMSLAGGAAGAAYGGYHVGKNMAMKPPYLFREEFSANVAGLPGAIYGASVVLCLFAGPILHLLRNAIRKDNATPNHETIDYQLFDTRPVNFKSSQRNCLHGTFYYTKELIAFLFNQFAVPLLPAMAQIILAFQQNMDFKKTQAEADKESLHFAIGIGIGLTFVATFLSYERWLRKPVAPQAIDINPAQPSSSQEDYVARHDLSLV